MRPLKVRPNSGELATVSKMGCELDNVDTITLQVRAYT